jgi:phosphoglycolate phosphatase-like HAD superfamily hydrolase
MTQSPSDARVYIQDGFDWDAQGAYLFDIDGTLLRSRDRVHYDAFFAATEAVLGHSLVLDGVVLHGNTDPGILRDAFRLARLDDSAWRGSLDAISAHMSETVAARRAEMDLRVMPGVKAILEHLQRSGAALGVATGNLESIGWIKIEVAGLREWFTFGGFSDGFDVRSDMIAHALRVARRTAGPGASVCVVGDTPADVSAARANGLPTIAVATGNYTFDQLMESRPEACATTLEALLAHGSGAGSASAQAARAV